MRLTESESEENFRRKKNVSDAFGMEHHRTFMSHRYMYVYIYIYIYLFIYLFIYLYYIVFVVSYGLSNRQSDGSENQALWASKSPRVLI